MLHVCSMLAIANIKFSFWHSSLIGMFDQGKASFAYFESQVLINSNIQQAIKTRRTLTSAMNSFHRLDRFIYLLFLRLVLSGQIRKEVIRFHHVHKQSCISNKKSKASTLRKKYPPPHSTCQDFLTMLKFVAAFPINFHIFLLKKKNSANFLSRNFFCSKTALILLMLATSLLKISTQSSGIRAMLEIFLVLFSGSVR